MRSVKLQAKHPLDYQGQHFEPGDVFEARMKDVLALRYRKKADFAPTKREQIAAQTAALAHAPAPAEPPEPVSLAEPAEAADARSRRRKYARRDLEPEP